MLQNFRKLNTTKILDGNIQYSDLFQSDTRKLKALSTLFLELLDIKETLLKENEPETLDPCTGSNDCLCNRYAIFTPVSFVCLLGNE